QRMERSPGDTDEKDAGEARVPNQMTQNQGQWTHVVGSPNGIIDGTGGGASRRWVMRDLNPAHAAEPPGVKTTIKEWKLETTVNPLLLLPTLQFSLLLLTALPIRSKLPFAS
ncbi:MAG: hypothetical protein Q9207_002665, partial [Kuettlingeria erythrocarpa]